MVTDLIEVARGHAYEVYRDGSDCLRIPRTGRAARALRKAGEVLTELAPRLHVQVPVPTERLGASEGWTHGAVVSRWLPGDEADASVDTDSVAAFLRDLHRIRPETVAAPLTPYATWRRERLDAASAGADRYGPELGYLEGAALREFPAVLDAAMPAVGAGGADGAGPAVVHGALTPRAIRVVDRTVGAVLDWEHVAAGDPPYDVAALWPLGAAWINGLFASLGAGDAILRRVHCYRLLQTLDRIGEAEADGDDVTRRRSLATAGRLAQRLLLD